MIIGQYKAKLTQKERVSVPAKFRRELGKEVVIAKWYEGCLVMVSQKKWTDFIDRLTGRVGIITEPIRSTDRFILGSAFDTTIDKLGRFVLPKILKEYAKIDQELVFIGLGDRVEIWDYKTWQNEESKVQDNAVELLEKLAQNK